MINSNTRKTNNNFISLGIVIYVISIIFGSYIGMWVCFIGGIVNIIDGWNHDPVQSMVIAIGVAKFFFSGVVGWVTFFIGIAIGNGFIRKG